MLTITPTKDYILLEPLNPISRTPGGLHIPEAHQNRVAPQGIVLEVGDECSCAIGIGDKVFFAQHTEFRAKLGDKEYILVSESNVIGLLVES